MRPSRARWSSELRAALTAPGAQLDGPLDLRSDGLPSASSGETLNDRLTTPAAEASAFFREVARDGIVWTLRDRGGLPAPTRPDHRRVQPFWSSRARAVRCAVVADGFGGFEPVMISWQEFRDGWLPGFDRDGMLVGVNWSGSRAMGYDLEPAIVRERVERSIQFLRSKIEAKAREAGIGGVGLERRLGRQRGDRDGRDGLGPDGLGRDGTGRDGTAGTRIGGASRRGGSARDAARPDSAEQIDINRREASG